MRPPPMALWSTRPRSLLRPPALYDGGCCAPFGATAGSTDEEPPAAADVAPRLVRDHHVVIDAGTAAKRPRLEDAARRPSRVGRFPVLSVQA